MHHKTEAAYRHNIAGMDIWMYCRTTPMARPEFIEPAHLSIEHFEPVLSEPSDGELLAEYAGRMCYMSQANPAKKSNREYLANILKQGHGSIMEHVNLTFLVEGVSRSFSHELVRHRAGFAYSQLSQRYVDEAEVGFVMPPAILESPASLQSDWVAQMHAARECYSMLVEALLPRYAEMDRVTARKTAREAARSVLPNATETKIVVTANVRAWRSMLELRCGPGAEREIRRWAISMLEEFQTEMPAFFPDATIYTLSDGTQAADFACHKV